MALRNIRKLFHTLSISSSSQCLQKALTFSSSLLTTNLTTVGSSWSNHLLHSNICGHRHVHTSVVVFYPSIFRRWKNTPEYTIKPIGMVRDGGRDPETGKASMKLNLLTRAPGRRINRRGGGHKRRYRMIATTRVPPSDGSVHEDKVLAIMYDPNRTARIALVGSGTFKKYILATMNMKAGDIIKTCGKIGRMTVFANEGDAYPVGALPIGSLVHNVELTPGGGGVFVRAAGTCAILLKKIGNQCILQLPSKRQISVDQYCMVTVGRLSNEEHNKRMLGKAGRKRWLGIRPKSGWFQRKGGWAGRKIKPLPPIKVYLKNKSN